MKFKEYIKEEEDVLQPDWFKSSEKIFRGLSQYKREVQPQALKSNKSPQMRKESFADFMKVLWSRR
jgi:hypothetical protein